MGGYGSGRARQFGKRRRVGERMLRIEVRVLKKRSRLYPNSQFLWNWTRGGEPSGDITIYIEGANERPECMRLVYRVQSAGKAEWETVNEIVPINWQPCRFGGFRPWLHCPQCYRRVAVLYGGARFLCRHCQRVSYACQREDAIDRQAVAVNAPWQG